MFHIDGFLITLIFQLLLFQIQIFISKNVHITKGRILHENKDPALRLEIIKLKRLYCDCNFPFNSIEVVVNIMRLETISKHHH